jgi:hypothetical protein
MNENEVKQIELDRNWWLDLGKRLKLGNLKGFSYRSSALFIRDNKSLRIDGAILDVLLDLDNRIQSAIDVLDKYLGEN